MRRRSGFVITCARTSNGRKRSAAFQQSSDKDSIAPAAGSVATALGDRSADERPQSSSAPAVKAAAEDFSFYYGDFKALKEITLPIHEKQVTALIGPSGCGKSTLLRACNRMHDLYPGNRYEGAIRLYPDNTNLLDASVDPIEVRMRIGMVFQKPNRFRNRSTRTSRTACGCVESGADPSSTIASSRR